MADDTVADIWISAIESRDPSRVRALVPSLSLEEDVFNGKTPVLYAAGTDAWQIVLLLLDSGANPQAIDRMGVTLAKRAAQSRVAPLGPEGEALAEVRRRLGPM